MLRGAVACLHEWGSGPTPFRGDGWNSGSRCGRSSNGEDTTARRRADPFTAGPRCVGAAQPCLRSRDRMHPLGRTCAARIAAPAGLGWVRRQEHCDLAPERAARDRQRLCLDARSTRGDARTRTGGDQPVAGSAACRPTALCRSRSTLRRASAPTRSTRRSPRHSSPTDRTTCRAPTPTHRLGCLRRTDIPPIPPGRASRRRRPAAVTQPTPPTPPKPPSAPTKSGAVDHVLHVALGRLRGRLLRRSGLPRARACRSASRSRPAARASARSPARPSASSGPERAPSGRTRQGTRATWRHRRSRSPWTSTTRSPSRRSASSRCLLPAPMSTTPLTT